MAGKSVRLKVGHTRYVYEAFDLVCPNRLVIGKLAGEDVEVGGLRASFRQGLQEAEVVRLSSEQSAVHQLGQPKPKRHEQRQALPKRVVLREAALCTKFSEDTLREVAVEVARRLSRLPPNSSNSPRRSVRHDLQVCLWRAGVENLLDGGAASQEGPNPAKCRSDPSDVNELSGLLHGEAFTCHGMPRQN